MTGERRINGASPVAAPPKWALPVAGFAVLFGIASIASGGNVIFGGEDARGWAGKAVPAVVWFNFLTGFLYIAAGLGIYLWQRWACWLASFLAISLIAVGAFFVIHVATGGAYEMRTVGALAFRTAVWISIAFVVCKGLNRFKASGAIHETRNNTGVSQ